MPNASEIGVVDVLHVVQTIFGIEGRQRGNEFEFLCVAHLDHNIGNCGIGLDTGFWQCFSCGASGDLVSLGARVLKGANPEDPEQWRRARREVLGILRPRSTEESYAALAASHAALRRSREGLQSPSEASIRPLGWYPPGDQEYLVGRGFDPEFLASWQIGWAEDDKIEARKGPVKIRKSVAIPIHDRRGNHCAWAYRATESSYSWQPRYLYTLHAPIKSVLFGDYRWRSRDVVVTEGALDAIWVAQAGFPAVGVLGSATQAQTERMTTPPRVRLLERYKSVTLFFDRDVAGITATFQWGLLLWRKLPCKVALYPRDAAGTDPQELAAVDLELAITKAVPWTQWRLKQGLQTLTS